MLRRPFVAAVFALAFAGLSVPAPAATTYDTVTLNVPVTVDAMPIGTTANIACYTPTVGAPTSWTQVPVPVQTQNGFVVYHGPPIVVVLKTNSGGPPGGPTTPNLVSGAYIQCQINWSPSTPAETVKDKYKTYSVQLQ